MGPQRSLLLFVHPGWSQLQLTGVHLHRLRLVHGCQGDHELLRLPGLKIARWLVNPQLQRHQRELGHPVQQLKQRRCLAAVVVLHHRQFQLFFKAQHKPESPLPLPRAHPLVSYACQPSTLLHIIQSCIYMYIPPTMSRDTG